MLTPLRALIVSAFTLASAYAQQFTSSCQVSYADNFADIQQTMLDIANSRTTYDQVCESSGNAKNLNIEESQKLIVKAIPTISTVAIGVSSNVVKQYCRYYHDIQNNTLKSSDYRRTVNIQALQLFNDCLKIENGKVEVSTTVNTTSVVVNVDGKGNPLQLNALDFDDRALNCTSNVTGNQRTINPGTNRYNANQSFVIICKRKDQRTPLGVGYPPVQLTLVVNNTVYQANAPGEEIYNPAVASSHLKEVGRLQQENATLKADRDAAVRAANKTTTLYRMMMGYSNGRDFGPGNTYVTDLRNFKSEDYNAEATKWAQTHLCAGGTIDKIIQINASNLGRSDGYMEFALSCIRSNP